MLPRNTLTTKNKWYFPVDLLSKDEPDVNPSILDIIMRIVGSIIRNIFNAIPRRNPWIRDFIDGLQQNYSVVETSAIKVQTLIFSQDNENIMDEHIAIDG